MKIKPTNRLALTILAVLFTATFAMPLGVAFAVEPTDIHTCEEFQAINDDLTGNYRLANDIDCSETSSWNGGEGFVPIGRDEEFDYTFQGTFDGNNKVISNITINLPDTLYVGVFGIVDYGYEIHDLRLANVNITGGEDTGGAVGYLQGDLDNVKVSGSVTASYDGGGLAGYSEGSTISNSSSSATVVSSDGSAGGLLGEAEEVTMNNSFATGSVYNSGDLGFAGGLVGQSYDSVYDSVYAIGNVETEALSGSSAYAGGLLGLSYNESIDNSFAIGNVTSQVSAGGLVGSCSETEISNSFAKGNVTGSFYLGGLIGYDENSVSEISYVYATGDVTSTVEDSYSIGGLIGYVDAGDINHAYATGDVDLQNGDVSLGGAGGLIGQYGAIDNTLSNAYATGNVSADTSINAGGLIGIVDGGSNGVIDQVYATGTVSANFNAGGLIGQMSDMLDISNAYATGDVSAGSSVMSAFIGLISIPDDDNPVNITNVYATGAIDYDPLSESNFGSLIGFTNISGGGTSDVNATNAFWDAESTGMPAVDNQTSYGSDLTTAEMKNIRSYVDLGFNDQLSAPVYDFNGTQYDDAGTDNIWAIDGVTNNGYPYFGTALNFDFSAFANTDADATLDSSEAAAPNNGDANNDGTPDKQQPNVTSFSNSVSGETSVVEVGSGCNVNIVNASAESAQDITDSGYEYPAGLMHFIAECATPGSTITVTQYFYGLSSDSITARKYNSVNSAYSTIDGATVSEVTIGGQTVTKVSYQLTDGGLLDEDGIANGVLVDPSGPGYNNAGTPNTGFLLLRAQ